MAMDIESVLILAVAPEQLVDAIIGDMRERRAALAQTLGEGRARATYRNDALRSVPPLAVQTAARLFASDWMFALGAAIVALAILVGAGLTFGGIPLWGHFVLTGVGYRMFNAAIAASILCCIPRLGVPSCAFLLVLTGIFNVVSGAATPGVGWHIITSDWIYRNLLYDGIGIASAAVVVGLLKLIRRSRSYRHA